MRFDFQTVAMHPDRGANPVLAIDNETTLNDVNNLAVMRNSHSLGRFQCPRHIHLIDHPTGNANHAAAIHRGYVRSSQADEGRSDFEAGSTLGFFDGACDGSGSRRQIDNIAFANTLSRFNADAQNSQAAFPLDASNQGANLGCADVDSHYDWIIHSCSAIYKMVR